MPSAEADVEAARLKGPEKPDEVQQRAAAAWADYLDKTRAAKDAVAAEVTERASRTVDPAAPATEGELGVTPLGTGSAVPSKYRNVSGTLLHLPRTDPSARTQYILLDAGEGTWGQIARRFGQGDAAAGEDSAEDVLRGLKMIFLSHLHQDHHAGVSTILRRRAQVCPFELFSPCSTDRPRSSLRNSSTRLRLTRSRSSHHRMRVSTCSSSSSSPTSA